MSLGLVALLCAGMLSAVEVPTRIGIGEKEFRQPELDIETLLRLPADLPKGDGASLAVADLAALNLPADRGRLDARSGRWATLTPAHPLVPGSGIGNLLTWEGLAQAVPADDAALRAAVVAAFHGYLRDYAVQLRLDISQLAGRGLATVHEGGAIAQIYVPRAFNGVPVRDSYVNAVINHGNLILFGTHKWGDIKISTIPNFSADQAFAAAQAHAEPFGIIDRWAKTELIIVPTARGNSVDRIRLGDGYGHRLAWRVHPSFAGELGRWEALVDAHSGELLAFEDTNRYAEVKGGVYPVTNDGVVPDGVEQAGWPMPFESISTTSGTIVTDTGGNVAATGSMTSDLSGPFVRMSDNCGAISLTQVDGIDFGTSGGDDCVTPGFGGAGNTHSSRSGFYELNRIKEMARAQLPSNTWLNQQLTANMNINLTCNAFWNGSTVNFYRSGGGCSNTGEIAGVFDHEWGHGMDDNDANPSIASPSGEGIADIYTALRLNDSCIGRNFLSAVCSGNGDPCLTCTGVRDIDYLQRQSGNPHDYTWANANCGGSVHCLGGVYSEAVWSLWKRKLQSAPYNYDNNRAHEISTRLTYIGAGAVGTWFSGGPPFGGCGGSGGYLNYLAADDDNGNLNDGTPHMQAIFEAFNDQQIACATPTVQDSGCAGTPSVAPNVTTSPGNQQIDLSWGSVGGATSYNVYRAEGIFACDFGKVKVGSTAGTSFNDTGLQNGRDYSYTVIPIGGNEACMGPASSCDTAQPASAPDFAVSCAPSSLAISQGGNDTSICSVTSSGGYTDNVGLSCSGNPAGVSCSFAPTSVSPPANGSANSTLTVTVSGGQATGTFAFDVVGNDGSNSRTTGLSVTVSPAGSNGPQIAVFDGGLGAPKCSVAGSSCDSTTLLNSRDTLTPAEPNQPNTLDVCNDSTSGTYHVDESNDRILISTLDGGNFTEGDTVEIAATIWAWSTFTADTLDLYYAADANSPSWTFITSIVPDGTDEQTLTAQYVLPAGGMQAVRANFRYQGTASPCSTGNWDDHDDLVFTVEAAVQCVVDADCSDGAFCNGDETCNAGQCEAGTAPVCDNGAFCDGTETCNEASDSCDPGTAPCDPGTETCDEGNDTCEPIGCTSDAQCDDGAFCNGAETCDIPSGVCQAGTAPVCDDGLFCNGSESCNEGTDSCDAGTAPACDDGLFCNGSESCNEGTDSCDAGTAPVCDDGQFCNGTETCDEANDDCAAGTAPCGPGQVCDEGGDICVGGSNPTIWMSFRSNTSVPGVGTVRDDDIVSYDETTGLWQMEFDGSDVGLSALEITGMAILPGGDLLLSFKTAGTVGGLAVDDSDIVRFTGTGGPNTSGTFSIYFDGSDVGLTSNGEDIDGIALHSDGRLLVSTIGGFSGSGASGSDEDLFLFTGALGTSTSGSFVKHFDGSDVGLGGNGSEDVDAAGFTASGSLLLSTSGSFSVTGLTGADEDIAEFTGTFGTTTSGSFSLRQDLTALGISASEDIGSLEIVE